MLEIDQLTIQSPSEKKAILTIPKLCFEADKVNALLGPNGAGKTSLFRAISGDMPFQGNIHLHGKPLKNWPNLHRAKHLGVLPQASTLAFPFTAQEVVELGLSPLKISRKDALALCARIMQACDCRTLAKQTYTSLSGGERQRVQLARVLVQLNQAEQAPLLLSHEPTSAQDLGQQHRLLQMVRSLTHLKSYNVICILHDLNQVLRYADYCCILNRGKLACSGAPNEVLQPETVSKYWNYGATRLSLENGHTALV